MAARRRARLSTDARREQLVALGIEIFSERPFDEVSIDDIAAAAGISKGLLYHYFPSKRDLFTATLAAAAGEIAAVTAPDPSLPPAEQLARSVAAYLAWIEEHADGYRRLLESAGSQDVRDLIEGVRERTVDQIVAGISGGSPRPALRVTIRAWLWGMDGAILDWLDTPGVERTQLRDLLLGSFAGAVGAASHVDPSIRLSLG